MRRKDIHAAIVGVCNRYVWSDSGDLCECGSATKPCTATVCPVIADLYAYEAMRRKKREEEATGCTGRTSVTSYLIRTPNCETDVRAIGENHV